MRPLFVGGCQRSGTTAFADYLNEHEAILITRERYKYLDIGAVNPRMFAFDRILDYSGRETNAPREYHERLLSGKDPAKLEWIGDKNPSYVRRMPTVLENNPGA